MFPFYADSIAVVDGCLLQEAGSHPDSVTQPIVVDRTHC